MSKLFAKGLTCSNEISYSMVIIVQTGILGAALIGVSFNAFKNGNQINFIRPYIMY